MSKSISLTNYNLRCMLGQLPDDLGVAGCKIVYDSGLAIEINKVNDSQLFITGISSNGNMSSFSSSSEIAKTVKL